MSEEEAPGVSRSGAVPLAPRNAVMSEEEAPGVSRSGAVPLAPSNAVMSEEEAPGVSRLGAVPLAPSNAVMSEGEAPGVSRSGAVPLAPIEKRAVLRCASPLDFPVMCRPEFRLIFALSVFVGSGGTAPNRLTPGASKIDRYRVTLG
jgi:hypothetical protein